MEEKAYWVAVHSSGLPPRAARTLVELFGSAKAFWEASPKILRNSPEMPPKLLSGFLTFREKFQLQKTFESLQKLNLKIATLGEPEYPAALKTIANPPLVLFQKGNWKTDKEPALAIVGSRAASPYGKLEAKKIAETLAQCGFTIVSGLAFGIDAAAHEGALEGKGNTVAVLGTGLDIIYPYSNHNLAARIEKQGALMSEFLPGNPPRPQNFPRRNRIISGLSLGVIVVEAGEKSGALITANFALEQGREVFAVPGRPGDPGSAGTNGLIQKGAKLVRNVSDILEEFPYLTLPKISKRKENIQGKMEEKILNLLKEEARGKVTEHLVQNTGSSVESVNAALLALELKGLISRLPGNLYVRT